VDLKFSGAILASMDRQSYEPLTPRRFDEYIRHNRGVGSLNQNVGTWGVTATQQSLAADG